MKNAIIFLTMITFFSCSRTKKPAEEQSVTDMQGSVPELELAWISDTLFRTPESVCFDKERNVLYVANVNLNPWEKDGNGFISKVDLSGNILELKWVEGLNGPKGMGISNGSLYVADIDELVEIDIATAGIIGRFRVDGGPDLNDITVGKDGSVYITGSTSNVIYVLADGSISEFQKGGDERYNGLYWEEDRLLLITSGSSQFKEIDWDTREVSVISEGLGHGDGIISLGDGTYLTSNWAGAIFYVDKEGIATKILDTEADQVNTADIDYSGKDNLLFIPTFFDNRVMAYRVVR